MKRNYKITNKEPINIKYMMTKIKISIIGLER